MFRAKVRIAVASLVVIASIAGPAARAESGEDPCQPDAEGPPGARMFHKLDPLSSGRVALAEFVAHRAQRFVFLDENGDGQVTRAEFVGRRGRGSEPERAAAFERLDPNGDGVVARAEWDAGETERFAGI